MPVYSYRCPTCERVNTTPRPIDRRDEPMTCPYCLYVMGQETPCERITDSPNFAVRGYNAKNGYYRKD